MPPSKGPMRLGFDVSLLLRCAVATIVSLRFRSDPCTAYSLLLPWRSL